MEESAHVLRPTVQITALVLYPPWLPAFPLPAALQS